MGVEIEFSHGYIEAVAPRLRGADITLSFPSVGATENLMMAAVGAERITRIDNAARSRRSRTLPFPGRAWAPGSTGLGRHPGDRGGTSPQGPNTAWSRPHRSRYPGRRRWPSPAVKSRSRASTRSSSSVPEQAQGDRGRGGEKEGAMSIRSAPSLNAATSLPCPTRFPTDLPASMMVLLAALTTAPASSPQTSSRAASYSVTAQPHGLRHRHRGASRHHQRRRQLERGRSLRLGPEAGRPWSRRARRGGRDGVGDIHHIDRGYEGLEKKYERAGRRILKEPWPACRAVSIKVKSR